MIGRLVFALLVWPAIYGLSWRRAGWRHPLVAARTFARGTVRFIRGTKP
jgi:hypothetical protein